MTTKERPILFSGPMVRAILDGRKTQTRRVVKPQPAERQDEARIVKEADWIFGNREHREKGWAEAAELRRCPYGTPGDRLWVRETFCIESNFNIDSEAEYPPPHKDGRPVKRTEDDYWGAYWEQPHYRATDPEPELDYGNCEDDRPGCVKCEEGDPHAHWRPSIHMPRWASRLTLEVTGVRVERLQEISVDDALAEGVERIPDPGSSGGQYLFYPSGGQATAAGVLDAMSILWDTINAKRGHPWESNPWVWVVEFEG